MKTYRDKLKWNSWTLKPEREDRSTAHRFLKLLRHNETLIKEGNETGTLGDLREKTPRSPKVTTDPYQKLSCSVNCKQKYLNGIYIKYSKYV